MGVICGRAYKGRFGDTGKTLDRLAHREVGGGELNHGKDRSTAHLPYLVFHISAMWGVSENKGYLNLGSL